jgi:protein DGCR14
MVGERTEDGEGWSKEIQTWKWTPMNVLMNPHPGLEDQEDPSQGQKQIRHTNTRIPDVPKSTGKTPAPSPSLSTVQDAIEGRSRADTPKVNGYSFVSTPKPTELGAPKMTWGSLSSTPISIEPAQPSPFRLAEVTEREKLARKLAEKAQKDITARQRAYTPRLRQTTASLGISSLGKTPRAGSATPAGHHLDGTPGGKQIPKFGSSPDVRRNMLTPAGQRLLAQSTIGKRSSSRLAEGRKERETAAQVSSAGRTPLMKTPMLKDAATPVVKR